MSIVLIDNYDSFTYNLYQYLQELSTTSVKVIRNDAIDFKSLVFEKPSHVVLSPGPGHPSLATDFGICSEIITKQSELGCPVLGVCLGHQGMVQHLGGQVVQAPEIMHGKTSQIDIVKPSVLFEGITSPFTAMRYHSLVAAEENFPDTLEITAREKLSKLIMAIQHKTQPMFGIQFHPESIGTPEGKQMLKNFLEKTS